MLKINIQKRLKGKGNFELHVNLDIPGDFGSLVLFGPSGSGKTLTLRCIAGLARPDQGFLAFNGHVFFDSAKKIHLSPQKRHVGYLPQDYALFPHLTLLQNVAYGRSGLFARFMRRGEKERALSLLEKFGIAGLAAHLPSELSGGQKQRAALARALNANPGLLLLDEPFAALDPLLREHMRKEIPLILARLNLPMIIITHDPEDVETFAGHLAIYGHGHCRLVDSWQKAGAGGSSASGRLARLQADFLESLQNRNQRP